MKICSKCKIEKQDDEFSKDSSRKDGRCVMCKTCTNSYGKVYRKTNSDRISIKNEKYRETHRVENKMYRDSHYDSHKEYRKQRKEYLYSLKTSCVKCGESRLCVIDFHHINNINKAFSLSSYLAHNEIELKEESKKCACLCKNCHYEFHSIYGMKPLNPIKSLTQYLGGDPYEIQLQQSRVLRNLSETV